MLAPSEEPQTLTVSLLEHHPEPIWDFYGDTDTFCSPISFLWGLFTLMGRLWGVTESWHVLSYHWQRLGAHGYPKSPQHAPSAWGYSGGGRGCFMASDSQVHRYLPKVLLQVTLEWLASPIVEQGC